jgi:hypothetical protein
MLKRSNTQTLQHSNKRSAIIPSKLEDFTHLRSFNTPTFDQAKRYNTETFKHSNKRSAQIPSKLEDFATLNILTLKQA